ncbi:MAG: multicopper oxidase family protein [Cryobacterium sp.]|nr:multicopper oxidase family protein [Micrococcales bacterium]MBX3308978.1 multicopper oxidase family protein [Cryobacterium sp.]
MKPISRRQVLVLGGLGTATILTGCTGLFLSANGGYVSNIAENFLEPATLKSVNGALQLKLTSAEGRVQIAGRPATILSYNGGVPGPTWKVQPGDTVKVSVENQLSEPTNLHVHGLHVSPSGNSDNVLVSIDPGSSFDYEYQLPEDHPPGVYWYHPHHHGNVATQVFGGLYGAIIVEDPTPIPVSRERVLVISDITLDASGSIPGSSEMDTMVGREGNLILVNGQALPTMAALPGERERWRIVNACASRYVRLRLDGQELQLLGIDSGRFAEPRDVTEVVLAPGNRADLLVTTVTGTATLQTLPVDRGSAMGMMGGTRGSSTSANLATLVVAGTPATALAGVPIQPRPRDLRASAVDGSRELVFAMGMGGMGMGGGGSMMSFTVDGKEFDPTRIDTVVEGGSVEEWTLTNTSPMDHPIHLHVWPMQIVEQNGSAVQEILWQDVVNVPANSRVRVRIPFDDFTGTTVYHCHILDHEDLGMMGLINAT